MRKQPIHQNIESVSTHVPRKKIHILNIEDAYGGSSPHPQTSGSSRNHRSSLVFKMRLGSLNRDGDFGWGPLIPSQQVFDMNVYSRAGVHRHMWEGSPVFQDFSQARVAYFGVGIAAGIEVARNHSTKSCKSHARGCHFS